MAGEPGVERAIDAGELVPGQRGWKQLAARITEVSLTMPRLDLHGQSILTQMLPLLAGAVAVPVEAGGCLMPLRWLLERIGDGVTLTQAGWLRRALVLEANDAFGWFDLFGFRVRAETDLPELASLDELARRARLITKQGRRVSLSRTGRRALGDPSLLWRIVEAKVSASLKGRGTVSQVSRRSSGRAWTRHESSVSSQASSAGSRGVATGRAVRGS